MMRKSVSSILTIAGAFTMALSSLTLTLVMSETASAASAAEQGKKLAFDRKKGNCLACHKIVGGSLPGNIGPALADMKTRFPNKADLRAQIWDPTANNANTIMPPFGKHRILSEKEIDLVVEFVHSL